MKGYEASTYGDRIAGVYDEFYGAPPEYSKRAEVLARLAGRGRALELGVGTGNYAIPLAALGFEVHGIDASSAMLDRLRTKDGGASVRVTLGDFANVDVEGVLSLVFVVSNTFFMLTTQEDQVRCFKNVAAHLDESGVFVVAAFVPDTSKIAEEQHLSADLPDPDTVQLDVSIYNGHEQTVDFQSVYITQDGIRLYPGRLRYAWPSELDLMAREAGLRLRERWNGWDGSRFTSRSELHVSVYENG